LTTVPSIRATSTWALAITPVATTSDGGAAMSTTIDTGALQIGRAHV